MIKFRKKIAQTTPVLLSIAFVVSCASVNVNNYPNITINKENKIETIKFTHTVLFSNQKSARCVLENVENKEIPIKHSVGMWAAFTIFTLLPDKKDRIEEGDVILSNDEQEIQAVGNVELESTINGRNFLIFQLTVKPSDSEGTDLLFNSPSIVLEDTGYGKNKGAFPLGGHSLSIFEKNYRAMERISDQIGVCLKRG